MANDFRQVIEYIDNDTVRAYNVKNWHEGTEDDPLTTIELDGYEDQKI